MNGSPAFHDFAIEIYNEGSEIVLAIAATKGGPRAEGPMEVKEAEQVRDMLSACIDHAKSGTTPKCRKCSCTDIDCGGCMARTGERCYWVEADLCSACVEPNVAKRTLAQQLAIDICTRRVVPGSIVAVLTERGGLEIGMVAVDDPIANPLLALGEAVYTAANELNNGKVQGGPPPAPRSPTSALTRDQAVELARRAAKAKPQSYYAEPFEPHEWVVDAVLAAAAAPVRAACIHCKQEVAGVDDVDAIRAHSMTCSASPVVQELQRQRAIVAQAEVVARHWHDQDGINSAELDKLKDLVLGEEVHGV